MKELIFKQPRLNNDDKFIDWFYWGFLTHGGFTSPLRFDVPNYQYIGIKDKDGAMLFVGDITNNGLIIWNDKLGNEDYGFVLRDIAKNKYGIHEIHSLDAFSTPFVLLGNKTEHPELLNVRAYYAKVNSLLRS